MWLNYLIHESDEGLNNSDKSTISSPSISSSTQHTSFSSENVDLGIFIFIFIMIILL